MNILTDYTLTDYRFAWAPTRDERFALTEKVVQVLRGLGDSPDTVAAVLEAQGCRGDTRAALDCPIARYLGAQGFAQANVSGHLVIAGGIVISTPPVIAEFIDRFDRGEYPSLEEWFKTP